MTQRLPAEDRALGTLCLWPAREGLGLSSGLWAQPASPRARGPSQDPLLTPPPWEWFWLHSCPTPYGAGAGYNLGIKKGLS